MILYTYLDRFAHIIVTIILDVNSNYFGDDSHCIEVVWLAVCVNKGLFFDKNNRG